MNTALIWDDARIFLAIARSGTLSGAAIALEMGIATVSRRLDRLEAVLGMPLFSRHQQGYRLTDDGEVLLERAEALEHAGHLFGEAARHQGRVAGCVRLATAENLANPLIIPSLPQLFACHPELQVEIVSGVQTVNLHRRDADLAVRMVKPEAGNVTIKRLGTLGFGLYGSASYLDARINGPEAGSFDHDRFIGWAESHSHLPAARCLTSMLRGRRCQLETTTLSAQIAAATAGVGLAMVPHFIARQAGLICLRAEPGADQPLWLAIHSDLSHSRRVRAVADHLIALFASRRNELAQP
ncbi:LysR family transcriptional regulator [Winslowiella iniecta]|uniref:LysR family transcriptional regulator n=1 Tax=Winslowiella iniecta TaxID=1560201 RepID=A0A0L7TBD4_9GAMM|nr:LysR family transcriptional regulator [Winslowiella iniecta]KOC89465.1 LysR family transcriptional regulator [Winslowiella iniecta]KOC92531.1 LysR family transcriptional regulator [Winslowiella iniecta]